MKESLKRLSSIEAPVCVTLVLNTHKTHPENQQDSIVLKNLIAEADQRLLKEYGADIAKRYVASLEKLANSIDHRHNDLGLMLFVNEDIAEYLRLPVQIHNRVILDTTFATRPIIRALKRDTDYYVLVLSMGSARLIEASSDTVVREVEEEGFPITDNNLHAITRPESSHSIRMTNLAKEFLNRIDKAVNRVIRKNPFSVAIYSEETNYKLYLHEADYPNTILGHVTLKNFDDKASNIVKEIWPSIKKLAIEKERARVVELEQALSSGNYLSDLNEIWRAVNDGRGRTIFVEEGYIQPVREDNGVFTPISSQEISSKKDINDIVDEMIEQNLKYGGDVVFLEKGSLDKFNKLALVTRY
ncbi:MAG TPA: hypothetical protein VFD78_04625 [Chitinophagaceae bacterium]|nr:hypothetical protein [Chitinophagaceae bacterium]